MTDSNQEHLAEVLKTQPRSIKDLIKSTTVDHEEGTVAIVFKAQPEVILLAKATAFPETDREGLFRCHLSVSEGGTKGHRAVRKFADEAGSAIASYVHYVARNTFHKHIYT